MVELSFIITNSGNTTLKDISLTVPLIGLAQGCAVGELAPGAASLACKGQYAVTQADVAARPDHRHGDSHRNRAAGIGDGRRFGHHHAPGSER